jgi:hypothetical protein
MPCRFCNWIIRNIVENSDKISNSTEIRILGSINTHHHDISGINFPLAEGD